MGWWCGLLLVGVVVGETTWKAPVLTTSSSEPERLAAGGASSQSEKEGKAPGINSAYVFSILACVTLVGLVAIVVVIGILSPRRHARQKPTSKAQDLTPVSTPEADLEDAEPLALPYESPTSPTQASLLTDYSEAVITLPSTTPCRLPPRHHAPDFQHSNAIRPGPSQLRLLAVISHSNSDADSLRLSDYSTPSSIP